MHPTCSNSSYRNLGYHSSFEEMLQCGLPSEQLYGACNPCGPSEKENKNEYCPEGYEYTSELLDNPWVRVAITLCVISALCLLAPQITAYCSDLLIKPLRDLRDNVLTFLSHLPLIDQLTVSGEPICQLGASVASIALGIYFVPAIATGSAVFLLSLGLNPLLLAERIIVIFLGESLQPKAKEETFYVDSIKNSVFSSSVYVDSIKKSVFSSSVIVPILEELLFRILLPFLYENACTLIGKSISYISGKDYSKEVQWYIDKTSIIFCSIIFGAAHFQNKHNSSYTQALHCGWSSVRIMQPISAKEGIMVTIGAHMCNNAFYIGQIALSKRA